MMAGQLLQGGEAVVGQYIPIVVGDGILRFVDDGVRTALLQCFSGILVAIERGTFQREEDGTGWTVAAVGCDCGMTFEEVVQFFYLHSCIFLLMQN